MSFCFICLDKFFFFLVPALKAVQVSGQSAEINDERDAEKISL